MKKIYLIIFLIFSLSLTSYAAKYKVNTGGIVKSEDGKVQSVQDIYSNFNSNTYINTKQAISNNVGIINIVMDYSGSMSYWIGAAKRCMKSIVSQLPSSTKVGLRVFGNDNGYNPVGILGNVKEVVKNKNGKYKVNASVESYLGKTSGYCSATNQMARIQKNNADNLLTGMELAQIGGATPLTYALELAIKHDFAGYDKITPKKIILITDGGETCNGDPCKLAANLVRERKDITVDVVLVSSDSNAIRCVADITGGKVYNPVDISSFIESLKESMEAPVENNIEQEQTQQYEFINY